MHNLDAGIELLFKELGQTRRIPYSLFKIISVYMSEYDGIKDLIELLVKEDDPHEVELLKIELYESILNIQSSIKEENNV